MTATALDVATNLTGAGITEGQAKTWFTTLRAALAEMGDPLGISGGIQNLSLAFSVGANALTCNIKTRAGNAPAALDPVTVAMRNAALATADFTQRNIVAALSMTVSSGSTLGHTSAAQGTLYWYLIDNAGALELAVSSTYYGASGIVSTTAEGGAGAADSLSAMYSTTARTNVPYRCIARTLDTQTTAGTWAAVPTSSELWPFTFLSNMLTAAAGLPGQLLCKGPTAANDTWWVPRTHIAGLVWSNNVADAANDIDISAGEATDDGNTVMMKLESAITKRLDANWAVGTAQGGLDTGAKASSTQYYLWEIMRLDTGVVDILFSISATTPTMPTNYTKKRLIGWVLTDGSSNIYAFHVYEAAGGGINFHWDTPTLDIDLTNAPSATARTDALRVPTAFPVLANINYSSADATGNHFLLIACPDSVDIAPAAASSGLATYRATTTAIGGGTMQVRTSAAGLIRSRSNITVDEFHVSTLSFQWARR